MGSNIESYRAGYSPTSSNAQANFMKLLIRRPSLIVCLLIGTIIGCAGPESRTVPEITPQPSRPPVTDRPKVIAYGDSLTSGFGLDSWGKAYPALLQKRLDAAGYDFQVLNYGAGGDTTERGLARLNLATGVINNKIFVLELGANDIVKGAPVAEMRANLGEIIKKLREKKIDILLCGFRAPESMGQEYREQVDRMYAELAAENGLDLLADFMEGVTVSSGLMQEDNIHPNENGAKVIEERVFNALRPLLMKYAPKK